MPELPEVETIVRDLNKKLKNKQIKELKVLDPKALLFSLAEFNKLAGGKSVIKVRRRAKMIIIELTNLPLAPSLVRRGNTTRKFPLLNKERDRVRSFLVIHLKMTGQLVYQSGKQVIAGGHPIKNIGKELPNKFTRVIFKFSDNSQLFFNDVRRFGWIKLVNYNELNEILNKFGVEPLSKEFTLQLFKEILSRKQNTTIKQALMDQTKLAGLGNIYTDETLFRAGIKPMRKVKTLKGVEVEKLHRAIPEILNFAIKHRGTSFNDYIDVKGEVGNFIKYLKVYGRAGKKCKKCNGIIKKIKIGGRGTHWCDKCQK